MTSTKSIIKSFIFTIAFSSFSFFAHAETVLTVAFEDQVQFPYYMGEGATVLTAKPGAAVELIQKIESKIPGVKVVFQRCPVKRCLNDLETGAIDGLFNISFQEARLTMAAYPWKDGSVDPERRLTTLNYSFYKPKGSDFSWDGKNVSGTVETIGATDGYSIGSDLEKMGITVSPATSSEGNLKKLIAGRVSAIAMQEAKGDYLISQNQAEYGNIEKVETPIKSKPYYLVLSNQFKAKDATMAEKIWDAVGELRKEQLDALIATYKN